MRLIPINKYPKQIHISDEIYRIRFVKNIRGESGILGECCFDEKQIKIKVGQSLTETFNTFVHECLHAIEYEYAIKVSHSAIYLLEKGISDFLVTNF